MQTTEQLRVEPQGRRERKKDATREALVQAAIGLFSKHGFDATTVEDIANAVDVAARTFHRYFPGKEDVLFADADERLRRCEAALNEHAESGNVLEAIRGALHVLADSILEHPRREAARQRLINSSTALRGHSLRHSDEWSRLIEQHTAAHLDIDPSDPLPGLLGDCTISVLRLACRRWVDEPNVDLHAEIDRGFGLIADLAKSTTTRGERKR